MGVCAQCSVEAKSHRGIIVLSLCGSECISVCLQAIACQEKATKPDIIVLENLSPP